MTSSLKRWEKFNFDANKTFEKPMREGTGSSDEVQEFHKVLKNYLKKELEKYGISMLLGNYAKLNYYDISFVVTKNGKYAYISFGDVRFHCGRETIFSDILFRSMSHDKDWAGGQNMYSKLDNLIENVDVLLKRMEEK